ncbi:MAG: nucleotidyltransferase domain-containing protein [Ardenticatenaceae bacterium]
MARLHWLADQRRMYQEALAAALAAIVAALARRPEVERVILFGSYAEGRRDLFTDLDILIVMQSPLDFVTRTAEMYRYLSDVIGVDVDLLVYTPEELQRNRGRAFFRQALEKGKVLYEKRAC